MANTDSVWCIGNNSVVEHSVKEIGVRSYASLQFTVVNTKHKIDMPVRLEIMHGPREAVARVFCYDKKNPEALLNFMPRTPGRLERLIGLMTLGAPIMGLAMLIAECERLEGASNLYISRSTDLPDAEGVKLVVKWQVTAPDALGAVDLTEWSPRPEKVKGIVISVEDAVLPPYTFRRQWERLPLDPEFTLVLDYLLDNSASDSGKCIQVFSVQTLVQEALARMQQQTVTTTLTGTTGLKLTGPPGSGIEINLQEQVSVSNAFTRSVQQTLTVSTQVGQTFTMEAEKGKIGKYQLQLPFRAGKMGLLLGKAMPLSEEEEARVVAATRLRLQQQG